MKITAGMVLEWKKRPLTDEEAVNLFEHIDALYEAIREAKLGFAENSRRHECFDDALKKAKL